MWYTSCESNKFMLISCKKNFFMRLHQKGSLMKKLCSLFLTFLKIGAFTFGGGYAMIALLENEFITRRHWMDQDEFLDMAAIAESTPGPVAVNSATYLGYKLGGVPRGVRINGRGLSFRRL